MVGLFFFVLKRYILGRLFLRFDMVFFLVVGVAINVNVLERVQVLFLESTST